MRRFRDESGQTLILIAAALVVLLGFLALAVDLGMLYAERRAMQNAADAGALAGARAMCGGGNVEAEARKFAEANGATTVDVRVQGNEIVVWASEQVDFYFAGVLGEQFRRGDASAVAASACGSAGSAGSSGSACALWPIALHQEAWNKAYIHCGEEFVVIDSKKQDYNGTNGMISGAYRGWLNFGSVPGSGVDCGGCGDIACWIKNTLPITVDTPIYINGQTGTDTSGYHAAEKYAGEVRSIPVYDWSGQKGCCHKNTICSPSGGPPSAPCLSIGCNDNVYHVVDVACVRVLRFCKKNENCQFRGSTTTFDEKVLIVEALCDRAACFQSCNTTTGGSVGVSDPSAASLIPMPDWAQD